LLKAEQLTKPGVPLTIHKIGTDWMVWTNTVDIVKAQIADSDDRFFYTGDGAPKQSNATMATAGGDPATYPATSVALGVQKPTSILTVEFVGTPNSSYGDVDVSYYYTYVTAWGEESAPADASAVTTVPGGQYVRLKNFVNPLNEHITHLRVYRVSVGTSGSAEFQLIKARPGSTAGEPVWDIPIAEIASVESYIYDANAAAGATGLTDELGEVCPSEDWDTPPEDLANLVLFMNNILVGSSGNEVCFSEPLVPYAWPTEYRILVEDRVVALGSYQSDVVVLTEVYPYIIQGSDPSRLSLTRLNYQQGCVSKRGVVSTRDGVIYPSPDGLMRVTGTSVVNLTAHLFTPEQWNVNRPETLIGFFYNDCYYGFYQETGKGFILTLGETPTLEEFNTGVHIWGGHIIPIWNTLALIGQLDNDFFIHIWEGGAKLTYTWKSKVFTTSYTNYAVAQIRGPFADGPITFRVYHNRDLVQTKTVSDEEWFWLVTGAHVHFEFEVEGVSEVDQVLLAHSPSELIYL